MSPAKAADSPALWKSAPLFAALGDERRLRLLVRLRVDGPASIARLSSDYDVTRQAIRKHLHVLNVAGLVRGERRGREHVWRLEPKPLQQAAAQLDAISAQWGDALGRLKRHVEDNQVTGSPSRRR
jgi:DNA-binding transcriptional ArsR family regulator